MSSNSNYVFSAFALGFLFLTGCGNDDPGGPGLTGETSVFTLLENDNSGISGIIEMARRSDNSTVITVELEGTTPGAAHPASIFAQSTAEQGELLIPLASIDGSTGKSETTVSSLTNGNSITYDELSDFDGHVKVFLSSSDLGTILAVGDLGPNVLTGDRATFQLYETDGNPAGTADFEKRENSETLVTLKFEDPLNEDSYAAGVYENNEIEPGDLIVVLNPVDGSTGMSLTNVSLSGDGNPLTFTDLTELDGHLSISSDSETLFTGGIGGNVLTGSQDSISLQEAAVSGVSGYVIFRERQNGETLVRLVVEGADNNDHPAHIHVNSVSEGGSIIINFSSVNGTSGHSLSNISGTNSGDPMTYNDLVNFNGHIKVHRSSTDFGTIVLQDDIGGNVLTGESESYEVVSQAGSGISGTVTFRERRSGATWVEFTMDGTDPGGSHPSHIHLNSNEVGGSIVISFNNIDGTTGVGNTTVRQMDDGTAITFEEMFAFDGHVKVHRSQSDFSIVAGGNIGGNVFTGNSAEYSIEPIGNSGVSGLARFEERVSGTTYIFIDLDGTTAGGSHPAHIHVNSTAVGGAIVISFANVDGTSGISKNDISEMDDGSEISYSDLVEFDGHIRIHISNANFGGLAQGNIGANAN